jgi:hypothetical protein
MAMTGKEMEYAERVRRFLKAELKRADMSYKDFAKKLTEHGLKETEVGIASKLARGTFSATFLLAALAVLQLEGIRLADL